MEDILASLQAINDRLEVIETLLKPKINITIKETNESTIVTGDTHPHKTKMKEIGGRWNPKLKAWVFTSEDASKRLTEAFPGVKYQKK